MTKLAPDWVRTSDPVIRSPARYLTEHRNTKCGLWNVSQMRYHMDKSSNPITYFPLTGNGVYKWCPNISKQYDEHEQNTRWTILAKHLVYQL